MNSAREEMKHNEHMSQMPMSSGNTAPRKEGKNLMPMPFKQLMSMKFLVVVILLIQLVILAFILPFSPLYILQQQTVTNQVINEVSKLTPVNVNEQPQVAVVADAEVLRKANAVQAQVYKDAANGDYVLVYSDKMIIYRRNDNKIVYQGDSPATLADKSQKSIQDAIVAKAKSANLIAADSTETPQLSSVTDAAQVKAQDASFYANVANGDIIALFPSAKVVVLYRPSTGDMVNSGTFNTTISPK